MCTVMQVNPQKNCGERKSGKTVKNFQERDGIGLQAAISFIAQRSRSRCSAHLFTDRGMLNTMETKVQVEIEFFVSNAVLPSVYFFENGTISLKYCR